MGIVGFLAAAALAAGAPEASTATAPSPEPEAVLAAVGDIRLDGPIGELIRRSGAAHPVSGVREALSADIVFGNLECPVSDRGEKLPKTWNFRAPARNLALLKEGGFTVVSVANNHAFDYGPAAFLDTLASLRKTGIVPVGGGKDLAEAEALRVVSARGLKVGFLAFTSTFPKEAWARKRRPGVAYSDFGRFPALVRSARAKVDALVVSFHGGTELAEEPNEIQLAFGREAIRAGADLVLGHHPHVLQAVELVDGKPVLHSLGNFLFVSPTPSTRATVVARAVLTRRGVSRIDFVPVDGNWGRPVPAQGELAAAARSALDRLGALTAAPELLRLPP